MSHGEPPFYPWVLAVTTKAIPLAAAVFVWQSIVQGFGVFVWVPPICMAITLVGFKLAAPRIPWVELVVGLGLIFGISWLMDTLTLEVSPLFFLLGQVLLPAVCVFGFGRRWVAKRYIPVWSNWWTR